MAKYIFVTGGVVSSLGKGITAASIGAILKSRGLKVFVQKFDPYINIDPGTLSPYQHGEVFVTDDGAETDLDLGHYERFIDERLSKLSSITSGKIYQAVINNERSGKYEGKTVQVIPHITNEIKDQLKAAASTSGADVIITEIGGTVGDIESLPFLEAIRQFRRDVGYENTFYIHCTLVPFLKASGEIKTKPTQHSVKELRSIGITPDMLVLRTEVDISDHTREKISEFCDVPLNAVMVAKDCSILYEIILDLYKEHIDDVILEHFHFMAAKANLAKWEKLITTIKNIKKNVKIAVVGKYVELHDAYLSVVEALKAACYSQGKGLEVIWINAEDEKEHEIKKKLGEVQGILVPGGFGSRGTDGKLFAVKYAREHKIPFLGICYGMQMAVIEYARDVLGWKDANSTEIDEKTTHPVIDYLPNQYKGINIGGTLRLGLYDCEIEKGTMAYEAYKNTKISERHRHRYEFNNKYLKDFEEGGLVLSGKNPQSGLVEIVEIKKHPFFVGCQFHPEFLSRPLKPHPLFVKFIKEAIKQ